MWSPHQHVGQSGREVGAVQSRAFNPCAGCRQKTVVFQNHIAADLGPGLMADAKQASQVVSHREGRVAFQQEFVE